MQLTIPNHTNAQNMTLNFSSSTRLLELDLSLDLVIKFTLPHISSQLIHLSWTINYEQ